MTAPSCRVVLMMPDAAPAMRGSTSRIAIVCSGANVMPRPKPATIRPGSRPTCERVDVRRGDQDAHAAGEQADADEQDPLAADRSAKRPATGATNIEISDIGAVVRPA